MTGMHFSGSETTDGLYGNQVPLTGFSFETLQDETAALAQPSKKDSLHFGLTSESPAGGLGTETTSGVQAMDRLHYDVYEAMDELSRCKDQEFGKAFQIFVEKMEQAFRQEERWMEEIEFSGWKAHEEQHARVLVALHKVHSRVMDGDLDAGREVVDQLLPQWFAFHIATLDMTLAIAMQIARSEVATSTPSDTGVLPAAFSAPL